MIDRTQKSLWIQGGTGPGEISGIRATFLLPGAGAFGRDKNVPAQEATSAKVSYAKDGVDVTDQVVTVDEAVGLLEQATRAQAAAAARAGEAVQRQQADQDAVRQLLQNLSCTVCGGKQFDEQTSREDSQMGMTTFRMRLLICVRCGFVMQFSLGRSLFVPGN